MVRTHSWHAQEACSSIQARLCLRSPVLCCQQTSIGVMSIATIPAACSKRAVLQKSGKCLAPACGAQLVPTTCRLAVIVLGGKARRSPCGTVRNSAVSEAVRKHSRRPVLLIADEHPLLCQTLPAIAEEEAADEDLSDEELDSQALLCSPKPVGAAADRILAGQLLASIGHTDAAHLTPSTLGPETAPAAQASTLSVAAC